MIRVRFEENRLTVCGHAGYAARGEDIVCAAVSALVYALIGDHARDSVPPSIKNP